LKSRLAYAQWPLLAFKKKGFPMAASLAKLDVSALLKLRDEVEARLSSMKDTLTAQLASLGYGAPTKRGRKPGRPVGSGKAAHGLKGTKRLAKYRDPETGTTWAGVGMTPKWIVAYEKAGKSRDQFATNGAAPKAKKRRAKKATRK
jgi:DNA-binding protein H-NS